MTLSIAAPEVLMDIKDCLREIRSRRESTQDLFKSPWDKCELSLLGGSKCLSGIRRRLSVWWSYYLAKQRRRRHNGSRSKGVYWDHLVQHVGGGNPIVLCLIPRRATIFLRSRDCSMNANPYRDLAVSECKIIREICEEFRPGVVSAADVELCKALFSLEEPSCGAKTDPRPTALLGLRLLRLYAARRLILYV